MNLLAIWRKYTHTVIAAAVAAVSFTSAAQAVPIYVAPCGNDAWTGQNPVCSAPNGPKLTIQAALTAASPGDTIEVAAGTYTENVNITKSLIMHGAQAGVDARNRVGPESIVIPTTASTPTFNVTFTGTLTVDGFSFSGGTSLGVIMTGAPGPNDGMQIINNRFSGYSQSAVYMNRGGTDITIDKNVMDGSNISSSGQAIYCSNTQSFLGLQITNNWVINNTGRYGVFSDGTRNFTESATRIARIDGNLFNNNLQGLNLGSQSFGVVVPNLPNPLLGPYAGSISNNTFSNHAANGFQAGPRYALIDGNTFQSNALDGIALTSFGSTNAARGAQNCDVTNNQFFGNGFTLNGEAIFCSTGQAAGTISTNHFHNNIISGNLRGATYTANEVIDMENNFWGSPTGPTDPPPGTNSTVGCSSGGTVADLFNPGGTGDIINEAVSNGTNRGIDYCPFTSTSVTLVAADTCLNASENQLVVEIRLAGATQNIVGGQFFLTYDTTRLSLPTCTTPPAPTTPCDNAILPGDAAGTDPANPFELEVYECSVSEQTGSPPPGFSPCAPGGTVGQIDYAVGVPFGNMGTTNNVTMARITFNIAPSANACNVPLSSLVSFRSHTPPSRLTNSLGQEVPAAYSVPGNITIDRVAPVITFCPPDITTNADPGGCTATVNPGTATATDNCTASPTITRSPSGNVFGPGPTTITWTATDSCGNTNQCFQIITVNSFNTVVATVELKSVTTPVMRAITFQFFNGATLLDTRCAVVNFNDTVSAPGSIRGTATFNAACGSYNCITVRDTLHTLRRTVNTASGKFGIAGTQYFANSTSTPGPDKSLISGNLNDDQFIDILDFGAFAGQFNQCYGPNCPGATCCSTSSGNTTCSTVGPHADFTGDGKVLAADYTYIANNFLVAREASCDGSALAGGGPEPGEPITRISVKELVNLGMLNLIYADFNHDGWLDELDMQAFINGGGVPQGNGNPARHH